MSLRYFCAIRNKEAGGGLVSQLFYTDLEDAEKFTAQWNKPGIGVYDCIGLLKDGATRRCKEEVAELGCIVCDLDIKNIEQPRDEIIRCLKNLVLPPSEIRDSGIGLHAIWKLREPVTDEPGIAEAETIMKQFAALLAGDPAPTHRAALLRRPGTYNSKSGGWALCQALENTGTHYDISEFADLFDLYSARALLTSNTTTVGSRDDHSKNTGEYHEPVDTGARLAAMQFQGPGETGIHLTQLSVAASELRHGTPFDEVVELVLQATRDCVNSEPSWDWSQEKTDIARMCVDFVNKNPETAGALPDKVRDQFEEAIHDGKRIKLVYKKSTGLEIRIYDGELDAGKEPNDKLNNLSTVNEDDTASSKVARKHEETKRGSFILRPFTPFDLATLPPREWLYGRHYQRRTVSATIAPGGFGKTSLCMVEAVAMGTARNLLGEQPGERLRVWYHNGEDNLEELQRRIGAICLHFNISQEELRDWLFLTSGNEVPLKVAEGYGNLKIDDKLRRRIAEAISDNRIDVAILDPLVTLHGVPEGDNMKMYRVISIFAGMADASDCSFELAHHTRKGLAGGEPTEYTIDDARGASSIRDAVRAARMLNHMSQTDAEAAAIPPFERTAYFRVDRAKANNAPPARAATWRRFINVDLPNGDEVGVVTQWEFPGQGVQTPEKAAAEQHAERIFLLLLDRCAAQHMNVSSRVGPNYAPAKFAREPEARLVSKAALVAAMDRLLAANRIRLEPYGRGDRQSYRLVRTPEGLI
jgi:RecA-family ATPase